MDADHDDKLHHQSSSFIIKQKSHPKLIIKLPGRKIIHQQQQQQCKEEAAEEEEMMKKKINMSVSKHNLLSISNSPNNSDSSLSTTCSICGKFFTSKKSLCGHMKTHPEREWRGIQPPSSPPLDESELPVKLFLNKYSSASTDSDDSRKSVESYQGVGPLPINWSVRGKRGRGPCYGLFISSDERIDDVDDERIDDAVKGLLMLKEGNKQIITMKIKRKKKRMILESPSEDVSKSTTSDLLRSSKKIKIDQERSCGSSRDGFGPKLISSNIDQSSQLEQLPAAAMFQEDCGLVKNVSKKVKLANESSSRDVAAAASNMFQEDCGLVKNVSKKVKLADESSSRDVLMNSIPEQLPHQVDFSLSKKLKLDDERGCSSSSSMFDQGSHLQQMFSNVYNVFDSKLLNSIPSSNHHLEHEMSTTPNGFFQGVFNSVFPKPAILLKATTTTKKKVKENEKGSSAAADQNMGMQVSGYELFKCDTCNRTFHSHQALGGHKSSQRNCKNSNISYHHHHQYQDYATGTHLCELCGKGFLSGQALGGHKREHFKGVLNTKGTVHVNLTTMAQTDQLNTSGTVHVNSTTMAQTDQLTVKSTMAQTEKLIKKEEMNRLSVVPVASSSVGEEVISTTTTTTVTKTENKQPVLDFDHNEIDLNATPDEMPDDQSWK